MNSLCSPLNFWGSRSGGGFGKEQQVSSAYVRGFDELRNQFSIGSTREHASQITHQTLKQRGFRNLGRVKEGLALQLARHVLLFEQVHQNRTQRGIFNAPREVRLNFCW